MQYCNYMLMENCAPLCVSGLGRAFARFHSSVHSYRVLTMARMAALKHHLSGVAFRAYDSLAVLLTTDLR